MRSLCLLPLARLAPTGDHWGVGTVELHTYLEETARQLAAVVGPLHASLSGQRPALPPVDQIDLCLLALGTALDGVTLWRVGGTPLLSPLGAEHRAALWGAHDAACALLARLGRTAAAPRESERRPWLSLSLESLGEAFDACESLGLLHRAIPAAERARLLRQWREAEGDLVLDQEAS